MSDSNTTKPLRVADRDLADLATRTLAETLTTDNVRRLQSQLNDRIALLQSLKSTEQRKTISELVEQNGKFATVIKSKIIPALTSYIYEATPVPGEHESRSAPSLSAGVLMPLIGVFQRFQDYAFDLSGSRAGQADQKRLGERLAHRATFYYSELSQQLEDSEYPDIQAISVDQLRLDILHWVLEELGEENAAATIRVSAMATARNAIRSANKTVEKYLAKRGPAEQFDFSAVLVQVEELVVLVDRIIEADRNEKRTRHSMVEDLGEQVVTEFIDTLGKSTLAVFRDIESRLAQGKLTAEYLERNLKKAKYIYTFCRAVKKPYGEGVFNAVNKAILKHNGDIVTALTSQELDGDASIQRDAFLGQLEKFLSDLKA